MTETVVGTFKDWGDAHAAVGRLQAAGFPSDRISIAGPHDESMRDLAEHGGRFEEEGAMIGAAAGGAMGAVGGWIVGLAAMAVPGIGVTLVGGQIIATLTGLLAGGATGGFVGALMAHGIPHEEALQFHDALARGEPMVMVGAAGREEEARDILQQSGALQTYRRDPSGRRVVTPPAAPTGPAPHEPATAPRERDLTQPAGMASVNPYTVAPIPDAIDEDEAAITTSGQLAGRG